MSALRRLRDCLPEDALIATGFDPRVGDLSADSRALQRDDVFVALAGARAHGLQFAEAALRANVAAIVHESPLPAGVEVPESARAIAIAVPDLRRKLGAMAHAFYDQPSARMQLVGVTGTNGKTSTVQLIAQALSLRGLRVGTIGTLGAGLHGQLQAGERTTPDLISVHRLLAGMRDAGATQVAMEVSSHALDQGRVDAVAFQVAVFTNLTRDHLDYHGTMEAYGAAKARLFAWPTLRHVVINIDDAYGAQLLAGVADGVERITVSSRGNAARLRAEQVRLTPRGLEFTLGEGGDGHALVSPLLGRFNVDNLLAVAGSLRALGWSLADVAEALPRLLPVGGRMNRIGGEHGMPLLVVDYAHTPDALEQALASVRAHTPGRLICVFGCGGERDAGKRPQMAAIAEVGADRVIVTDDNPRNEDGDAIVRDILAGFRDAGAVVVNRDRAAAIAQAVAEAGAGDLVLIAGKGHEPYQEVRGVKTPFDDLQVARRYLEGTR